MNPETLSAQLLGEISCWSSPRWSCRCEILKQRCEMCLKNVALESGTWSPYSPQISWTSGHVINSLNLCCQCFCGAKGLRCWWDTGSTATTAVSAFRIWIFGISHLGTKMLDTGATTNTATLSKSVEHVASRSKNLQDVGKILEQKSLSQYYHVNFGHHNMRECWMLAAERHSMTPAAGGVGSARWEARCSHSCDAMPHSLGQYIQIVPVDPTWTSGKSNGNMIWKYRWKANHFESSHIFLTSHPLFFRSFCFYKFLNSVHLGGPVLCPKRPRSRAISSCAAAWDLGWFGHIEGWRLTLPHW